MNDDNEERTRRRILEAKSKFYDRMTASGGSVNSDDSCLVLFNAKKQTERVECSSSEDDDVAEGSDEDTDWVEYTDSLGRTRKCLRTDLEFFKKRDAALAGDLVGDTAEQREHNDDEPKSSSESEDELLKTGRQVQQMRDQWEKQEEENKDKSFVHYQDVLFDEARTHGVGYYQFSKDAEERLTQQKQLESVRKATLSAQKERGEQREARERIIAERVLAAKRRQRARLGLPVDEPLSGDIPNGESKSVAVEEVGAEQRTADKLEKEALKDLERKSDLRPWDEGKEGTSHLVSRNEVVEKEWSYNGGPREPMSQEEWNGKKREERISEFAPTASLNDPTKSKRNKKNKRKKEADTPVKREPVGAYPDVQVRGGEQEVEEEEEERPGLYFTTKKKLKRKNYQPAEEEEVKMSRTGGGGAEVPPPPTFDYYGPPLLGLSKKPKTDSNLETSIDAGLKFLRNQTDKSQLGSQSLWGANANYTKDM